MPQLEPDLILKNARIVTMEPSRPAAGWVAARDGKITAVGGAGESPPGTSGDALAIDCRDAVVLPAFTDSHLHLLSFVESLISLDVSATTGIRSIADIQTLIARHSKHLPPGTWIRAGGYHEFDLVEKRHPNRHDLDRAAPNHPVKLSHRTGHAHVLNTPGLESVGISVESEDPDGGMIDRELDTGLPSGLLYEMGPYLSGHLPPLDEKEIETGIGQAGQLLLSFGITSVHDASAKNDKNRIELLRRLKKKGCFGPRLNMMMGINGFRKPGPGHMAFDSAFVPFRLCGVKIILDETTGRLHPSREQLDEWVMAVHESGMQVAIHAVEETAIESACMAIEKALLQSPRPDHRHRIEHCSLCPPSLADRIAKLGIRVVSQPGFIAANGGRYLETVPSEKIPYLYPFGSLLKRNVRVAGSSDCPVAPVNPWLGICAAVTRKSTRGLLVGENETVDVLSAMRMYTIHGAEAHFSESSLGSISPGKSADIIIIDKDPFQLLPEELRHVKVDMTIMDGKVVWKRFKNCHS